MNIDFLPHDYEVPSNSNNFLKLKEENRIRILSAPIIGWEDWTLERKPIRFQRDKKPINSIDPKKPIKHFWSLIVYSYNDKKIMIYHITQLSIIRSIDSLLKDSDWGNASQYDIKITKKGEGIETKYHITPVSFSPVDPLIIKMFNDTPCNLEALFTNDDPFSRQWSNVTPLAINSEIQQKIIEVPIISAEQFIQLGEGLNTIPNDERTRIETKIEKLGVSDMSKMPVSMFAMVMHSIESLKKVNV